MLGSAKVFLSLHCPVCLQSQITYDLLSKHFQFLVKHVICSSNQIEPSLFPEPLESNDILIPDFNIILDFATAVSENH